MCREHFSLLNIAISWKPPHILLLTSDPISYFLAEPCYSLVICGLGLIPVRSCDQKEGTDPRNWRNEV